MVVEVNYVLANIFSIICQSICLQPSLVFSDLSDVKGPLWASFPQASYQENSRYGHIIRTAACAISKSAIVSPETYQAWDTNEDRRG